MPIFHNSMSALNSIPYLCEHCGQEFPSYEQKKLHSQIQCIQRRSSSGADRNMAERRSGSSSSYGYGTHPVQLHLILQQNFDVL